MTFGAFVDLYEVLQVSANADTEMIHRVYRLLAQRYHPDNAETGDLATFRRLTEAHKILVDPEARAAYDLQYRSERKRFWQIFDSAAASAEGPEAERRKRAGILSLLYRKRVASPDHAQMSILELEDLLGVPREHLEFALWYLKESGQVTRTDSGRYAITLKGVDAAECVTEQPIIIRKRIEAAA
ncbi:MAG: J domain-containing protein [Bryobacteraceae bacterium]|nr:J domain-containing protein [Bryobacteraceae bacterium]